MCIYNYIQILANMFSVVHSTLFHSYLYNDSNRQCAYVSLHANLRFTFELGPDRLAFLVTHISLPTNDFDSVTSTVYRKPTNTNVILNFAAMCPWNWKSGLITCFINRAYTVCSTWQLFHSEMTRLRNIFRDNGYPFQMFDRCLNVFMDKKHQQTPKMSPIDLEFTPIICLPYTGYPSLKGPRE